MKLSRGEICVPNFTPPGNGARLGSNFCCKFDSVYLTYFGVNVKAALAAKELFFGLAKYKMCIKIICLNVVEISLIIFKNCCLKKTENQFSKPAVVAKEANIFYCFYFGY
jgi:hypothetical protein